MAETTEKTTHTLSLRLAPADYEQVRVMAFLTGKSINAVIRDAIRAYSDGEGHKDSVQAAVELVRRQHRGALDKLA